MGLVTVNLVFMGWHCFCFSGHGWDDTIFVLLGWLQDQNTPKREEGTPDRLVGGRGVGGEQVVEVEGLDHLQKQLYLPSAVNVVSNKCWSQSQAGHLDTAFCKSP